CPPARGDGHLVDAVELAQSHVDVLGARGGQVLPDVVGANRQLAVAAVGEHGQLHALGATVGEQRLDRGADGATGEEDVVDDHDSETGEVEVDVGGVQDGGVGSRGDVIAVEADVEVAEGNVGVEQLLEQDVQTLGEEGSAAGGPSMGARPRGAAGAANTARASSRSSPPG